MPCGPQMVGRVPPADDSARAAAPGIAHRRRCLGPGRVAPSETDRRRVRTFLGWLGWAAFALLAAVALLSALSGAGDR